jgi:hypothetical protein
MWARRWPCGRHRDAAVRRAELKDDVVQLARALRLDGPRRRCPIPRRARPRCSSPDGLLTDRQTADAALALPEGSL